MKAVFKKISALLLMVCLMTALVAGCSGNSDSGEYTPKPPMLERSAESGLKEITSYSDVYSFISEIRNNSVGGFVEDSDIPTGNGENFEDSTGEAVPEAGEDESYSFTNVQVAGIDEADTVKTDGEYIYILGDTALSIAKADGSNTAVIANIEITQSNYEDTAGKSEIANNMYISGDRLVILKTVDEWWEPTVETDNGYKSYTSADIYDISDPTAPTLITKLGQDGYLSSSRMIDGIVYIVSNYSIYEPIDGEDDTYIPSVYKNSEASTVLVDDIFLPINTNDTSWTVISAIDVASENRVSTRSILGGNSTVYMNLDTLYVACNNWHCEEGGTYTEAPYSVVEYLEYNTTDIMAFDYSSGKLELKCSGTLPGYLVNQFALDEYNGNLRAVTTDSFRSYRIYTDENHGWSNYEELESGSSSGLYVMDASLEIIGKVDKLAEDERVYSVRFDGDIGYFVTFLQVDPLFAVDLKDPAAPQVLSALKIPGFSSYLHKYTDGRLLGLGMSVDEETGWGENVKLSMFDTTVPEDVTEKYVLTLETAGSAALHDHHAILVNSEKDIIAFPVDNGYAIYGYNDETGFYERVTINIDAWTYNSRGLFIGDFFYICSPEYINVLNLGDLSSAAEINTTLG